MRLVIVGTGEHAKTLFDLAVNVLKHRVVGFTDHRPEMKGQKIFGIPVLGFDDQIIALKKSLKIKFTLMGIGNRQMVTRRKVAEFLTTEGIRFLTIVHPHATVSPTARLGEGDVVMAGAVVNSEAILGNNVVVNNGAVVDHTCNVGDNVYISPNATLCGNVRVGSTAFIGAGATIIPDVNIGEEAVIGAGAVVLRDVKPGETVVGVPARTLFPREPKKENAKK